MSCTAQAIADEGELEVLGQPARRVQQRARADGRRPQLDNLDTTPRRTDLRVFTTCTGSRGGAPRSARSSRSSRDAPDAPTRASTSAAACAGGC
jgi:hypothetical protein